MSRSCVVALNNQALELIKQESYGQAISKLKTALRQLRNGIASSPNRARTSSPRSWQCPPIQRTVDATQEMEVQVQALRLRGCSFDEKRSAASHTHFLFDRVLLLLGAEESIFSSRKSEERATGVIIYNMALVHHLVGLQGGADHTEKLHRASRLYEMVSSTVTLEDASDSSSDCLLYLASLNNKGMIHAHFYETHETQTCLERLCMILQFTPRSLQTDDDIFYFRMNVFLWQTQHLHAPAA